MKFCEKIIAFYEEVEKEPEKIKHEQHTPEPYFAGISLYPIKIALDNMVNKK